MSNTKNIVCVAFVDDNGLVCTCNSRFSKTCFYRIINNLDCKECSVMITPLEVEDNSKHIVTPSGSTKCNNGLLSVINHLRKVGV